MASLRRIEIMSQWLEKCSVDPTPPWISGRKLYEISGPDNSALGCHFSGKLREVANMLDIQYPDRLMVIDESGNEYDLAILIDEAAERLDDAHEEWLEDQCICETGVIPPTLREEET